MTTVTNGVNVQALLDAREVLKGAPEAAQFTWRASAKWQSGVHSTIKVQSFFGLGEEQSHKEEWTCSKPTTPRSSRRRTTASRRSSTSSSAWRAA